MQTVFQITFLEDVLSVTNALSLLLQSDVKDFASISCIVSSTLQTLEDIGNDFDSIHLKSFNKSAEIIEKIKSFEKQNIVSSQTRTKRSRQDQTDTHKEFHENVIQPFIIALTKETKDAFDLTNLSVLNSFLKLDPQGLPRAESTEFPTYGEHKIKELCNLYSTTKEDTFQERTVTTDVLLDVPINALLIEYAGFENYVAQQKVALSEKYTAKEKSLKAKYLLVDSQKQKTRKQVKANEEELELNTKRKLNPLSVEDLYEITLSKPHSLMFNV